MLGSAQTEILIYSFLLNKIMNLDHIHLHNESLLQLFISFII